MLSTLNVGTANATTVNVGTGGLVFNDGTTQTTAPNPALALNDLTNVTAGSPSTDETCNGMDLHGLMQTPLVVLMREL